MMYQGPGVPGAPVPLAFTSVMDVARKLSGAQANKDEQSKSSSSESQQRPQ